MTTSGVTDSAALADALRDALEDGKAVDIRVLDVSAMTVITDYMIVASGRSSRQVRALTERVRDAARTNGATLVGVEGERGGDWILVDFGGVIVHLMQPDAREFYQLEKLWEERPPAAADAL